MDYIYHLMGNAIGTSSNALIRLLKNAFATKILDFTQNSAQVYARLMGESKQAGNSMSIPDGQIAAIALANGYTIATRNIKDFNYCGLDLINPFTV